MSKLRNLENYLQSGASATPRQITRMFGLSNPSAAIHELRSRGNLIYCNETTLTNGQRTVRYQIGKPTKNMVRMLHAIGFIA